jgi:hypothetical protein
MKDTNGDGVADGKLVVLTGFSGGRTAQLRVSYPTLGLDGKSYLTSGLQSVGGGKFNSPERTDLPPVPFPTPPVDGRFDPETLDYETVGGEGAVRPGLRPLRAAWCSAPCSARGALLGTRHAPELQLQAVRSLERLQGPPRSRTARAAAELDGLLPAGPASSLKR